MAMKTSWKLEATATSPKTASVSHSASPSHIAAMKGHAAVLDRLLAKLKEIARPKGLKVEFQEMSSGDHGGNEVVHTARYGTATNSDTGRVGLVGRNQITHRLDVGICRNNERCIVTDGARYECQITKVVRKNTC